MQRHLRYLQREQRQRNLSRQRRKEHENEWDDATSLGSLARMPNGLLQELLTQMGANVRGASRALLSAFDACNKRLRLRWYYADAGSAVDHMVDMVQRTPLLEDLGIDARSDDPDQLSQMLRALVTLLPLPHLTRLSVMTLTEQEIDLEELAPVLAGMPGCKKLALHGPHRRPQQGAAAPVQSLAHSLAQLPVLRSAYPQLRISY